jgi:hypothetical protein
MAKLVRASMRRLLAATALAAIFTAAAILPPPASGDSWAPTIAAAKEKGNHGGANNGGGNNGDGNNGGGNNGGGNDGGGNNGGGEDDGGGDDHGGGDHGGGEDDGGGDDHGGGPGGGGGDEEPDAGEDPPDDTHVDEETGAAVEVEGENIEVTYPDGWTEELQDGWFELKDPAGRTVVERRATRKDIRRLWILAR